MRRFVSRLLAAGLSAGVVLVWWPHVFADTDSAASWVARGLFWTLISELLAMGLGPLEELLWTQTRAGRAVAAGAARVRGRVLDGAPARRRAALVGVVAATTLALPIGLIVQGQPVAPATPPGVVRVTKVVRPVTVQRVTTTVQQAPPVPGGAAAPDAPPRTVTTVVGGAGAAASDDRRARAHQERGQDDRSSRTATRPPTTVTTTPTTGVDGPASSSSTSPAPTDAPAAPDGDAPAAPRAVPDGVLAS